MYTYVGQTFAEYLRSLSILGIVHVCGGDNRVSRRPCRQSQNPPTTSQSTVRKQVYTFVTHSLFQKDSQKNHANWNERTIYTRLGNCQCR